MDALAEMSYEFMLAGFSSGSYDLLQGHCTMYAARAVALAEALVVELEKLDKGDKLTEEEAVVQGQLFTQFRGK